MKKIILIGMVLLIIPFVLADYGSMMGYGMMGNFGLGLFGIVWFVLATFVFSVIFWSTYNMLVKKKKTK